MLDDLYVQEIDMNPRMDLVEAARDFLRLHGDKGYTGQVCLQKPSEIADDDERRFSLGAGSFSRQPRQHSYKDFDTLFPESTWVKPILDDIERHSGGKAVRARLMTMEPKTCLSLHKDAEIWRYHFVVLSHPRALFFVQNTVRAMHVLGGLYRLRTNVPHTAINAGFDEKRTHLVVCIA